MPAVIYIFFFDMQINRARKKYTNEEKECRQRSCLGCLSSLCSGAKKKCRRTREHNLHLPHDRCDIYIFFWHANKPGSKKYTNEHLRPEAPETVKKKIPKILKHLDYRCCNPLTITQYDLLYQLKRKIKIKIIESSNLN